MWPVMATLLWVYLHNPERNRRAGDKAAIQPAVIFTKSVRRSLLADLGLHPFDFLQGQNLPVYDENQSTRSSCDPIG
jgi:hypothetical protein